MNEVIIKRAIIFSLIFGALIGLISLIPALIGFCLFTLAFLAGVVVIMFMKKNEKYLGIIDAQQGAILGGIAGFFASVGFFASFCPMVILISAIFKKYYAYAIPYIIEEALWLFFVIILMVGVMLAIFNAVGGMAMAYIYNKFEQKPENYDARLDIKVDD